MAAGQAGCGSRGGGGGNAAAACGTRRIRHRRRASAHTRSRCSGIRAIILPAVSVIDGRVTAAALDMTRPKALGKLESQPSACLPWRSRDAMLWWMCS